MITFLDFGDQMTMSGREVVAQMQGGKVICAVSKSTSTSQSLAPSSREHFSTFGRLGFRLEFFLTKNWLSGRVEMLFLGM
jgi:hypothetical protein